MRADLFVDLCEAIYRLAIKWATQQGAAIKWAAQRGAVIKAASVVAASAAVA